VLVFFVRSFSYDLRGVQNASYISTIRKIVCLCRSELLHHTSSSYCSMMQGLKRAKRAEDHESLFNLCVDRPWLIRVGVINIFELDQQQKLFQS
jgi:hypothetical protein